MSVNENPDNEVDFCHVVEIQVTIVVSISSKGTGNIFSSCTIELVWMGVDERLHTICIQLPIVGCCLFGIGELQAEFSLVYPYTNRLKKDRYRDIH